MTVRRLVRYLPVLALPLAASRAQTPAVTLEHESKHHIVFTNEWVRVLDVTVPVGDSTLYHVHSNDYVFVTFGPASLKAQPQGSPQTDLILTNGEVRFTKGPITHRVVNLGKTPFHNLTIELLKRSNATLAPAAPTRNIVLDNDRVRVERIVLEPGQSAPSHEHVGPRLDVAVTAGKMSSKDARGNTVTTPYEPASYHWNAARGTHVVTNTGGARMELLEVEWK